MTTVYNFDIGFTKLGVAAAPSDTPVISVINVATDGLLVTAQAMTKSTNLTGACTYAYSGADNLHLIGLVHSTDTTLDQTDFHISPNISESAIITAINAGVASGTPVSYAPTSTTIVIGNDESPSGEDYTDLAAHDGVYMQIGENNPNGLEFIVARATSSISEHPSTCRVSGHYDGSPTHSISFQAYNYTTSSWDEKGTLLSRNTDFDYTFPLTTDNHNGSGQMQVRFKHSAATGTASHFIRIDYVSFEKVASNNAMATDIASILSTVLEIDTDTEAIDLRLPALPAAVGSEMLLTSAYDAAKTAAQAGDQMDLIDALNATAITAIQSGLATPANVWSKLLSEILTPVSIGKLIKDYLDVAVSTRATPADISGITVNASVAVSSTVAALVATGYLAIEAGCTFRQTIDSTITDDLNAATKLWLAIKSEDRDDNASMIFIEKTDGLTRCNGAAYPAASKTHGSLTITGSSGDWHIAIYIDEIATALLFDKNKVYDAGIKAKIGNDEKPVWEGKNNAQIVDGVVRTV